MDVISLHQAGFDSAVASLGTSLTAEHARLLARYAKDAVIAYDGDGAGRCPPPSGPSPSWSRAGLECAGPPHERGPKDPDEYHQEIRARGLRRVCWTRARTTSTTGWSPACGARYDLDDDAEGRVEYSAGGGRA